MKTQLTKLIFLMLVLFLSIETNAQATKKKTATKSKSTNQTTKVAPVAVTVALSSKCEKQVMVYAGPKENLHEPKQRQLGGLSKNTLYLKTGDVICVMDAKKKPISCVTITKSTLKLEINIAGTAILAP